MIPKQYNRGKKYDLAYRIMSHPELSSSEARLLWLIQRMIDIGNYNNGICYCYPKLQFFEFTMNLSKQRVITILKNLEEKNFIKVERQHRKSNKYYLLEDNFTMSDDELDLGKEKFTQGNSLGKEKFTQLGKEKFTPYKLLNINYLYTNNTEESVSSYKDKLLKYLSEITDTNISKLEMVVSMIPNTEIVVKALQYIIWKVKVKKKQFKDISKYLRSACHHINEWDLTEFTKWKANRETKKAEKKEDKELKNIKNYIKHIKETDSELYATIIKQAEERVLKSVGEENITFDEFREAHPDIITMGINSAINDIVKEKLKLKEAN